MEPPKPLPTGPDVDRLHLPEELQQQLHDANARLHQAKQGLEVTMDESDYDHQEHVKRRFEEFRKIEKEIEDLNEKVKEILGREVKK
jgi:hypothetical protein